MIYIGIDNGVSGTIGVRGGKELWYGKMPTFNSLDYTKKERWITRIETKALEIQLRAVIGDCKHEDVAVTVERPMVNPGRFNATKSALRAFEATLITVERIGLSWTVIDSKEWQKMFFPKGIKGDKLKAASLSMGRRLFPKMNFDHMPDADGLLIAEFSKRRGY